MKLPVTLHRPRLGPAEFNVIRPARTPDRALLLDADRYLNAYFDQEAAQLTAGLWALAASSPRSLIHLPIRPKGAAGAPAPGPRQRPLDLVLLHHSLQFAPSRWKELRARLGAGRAHTVVMPGPDPDAEIDGTAPHHREDRDVFRQHVHSETLFMTGSARTFRDGAALFADLARHGPHQVLAHPGTHYCRRLFSDSGREVHIEYAAPSAPTWHQAEA
ncbi:hypothetical protein [Streptomyces goshikiensis]|uniref:hypothetical protein n=1 Tax=Streptomyces goshikiensis TaxID=1942 RepID=UPI0036882DE5